MYVVITLDKVAPQKDPKVHGTKNGGAFIHQYRAEMLAHKLDSGRYLAWTVRIEPGTV